MYTGSELAHHIPPVSSDAHRSPAHSRGLANRSRLRAQRARQHHATVCQQQKGRPQHGWSDSKVIIEMAGARSKFLPRAALRVQARFAKAGVRGDIVAFEIQTVID